MRAVLPDELARYDLVMTLFGLSLELPELDRRCGGRFRRMLWMEFLLLGLLGAIRRDGDSVRLKRGGEHDWAIIMRDFFISPA